LTTTAISLSRFTSARWKKGRQAHQYYDQELSRRQSVLRHDPKEFLEQPVFSRDFSAAEKLTADRVTVTSALRIGRTATESCSATSGVGEDVWLCDSLRRFKSWGHCMRALTKIAFAGCVTAAAVLGTAAAANAQYGYGWPT
jgi:hypothetical protein